MTRTSDAPLGREPLELATVLLEADTVSDVLHRVVHAAQRIVPGAELVSVTVLDEQGSYETPAYSDPRAIRFDEIQYRTGEGPCLSATCPNGPDVVLSEDLNDDPRWPAFGPSAAREGMRSLLAVGLFPGEGAYRSGALNIYAAPPGALDAHDQDLALLLAAHASTALAAVTAAERHNLRTQQFTQALASRDVIGQAKGILMERRGLSADEAFQVLVRTSQQMNTKLAEVAATLAARREDL